jgi:ribosomal protein L37AE/L43A
MIKSKCPLCGRTMTNRALVWICGVFACRNCHAKLSPIKNGKNKNK